MNKSISVSMQDYIESVYRILEEKPVCRVSDLKDVLGVSKPSVVSALSNLKSMGLIKQEKYGYVELTDSGLRKAKSIYDKHLSIKMFLIEMFGSSEKDADEMACRMEHIVNVDLAEKMKRTAKILKSDIELKKRISKGV